MKLDALKQFSRLRNTLLRERTILEKRLEQINSVVGVDPGPHDPAAPEKKIHRRRRQGARRQNGLSLRQAIIKVTSAKPMTKEEILTAVKKAGYRFSTARPMATINAYLYQKGAFVRKKGRFAPGKSSSISTPE